MELYLLSLVGLLQFMVKPFNMTQKELENIINSQKSLLDLPNSALIKQMDLLTEEHENIKQVILKNTTYLDTLEELYNNILKVYQQRKNG